MQLKSLLIDAKKMKKPNVEEIKQGLTKFMGDVEDIDKLPKEKQLAAKSAKITLHAGKFWEHPAGVLKRKTSLIVMAVMVAGLIIWLKPDSFRSWGMLLYIMIVITTTVGVVGALIFNRYFWCSICPMGKIYKMIRPGKSGIQVDASCVRCGLCAKACPFDFFPPGAADGGIFRDPDCMHCRRCVERCPKHALSLKK